MSTSAGPRKRTTQEVEERQHDRSLPQSDRLSYCRISRRLGSHKSGTGTPGDAGDAAARSSHFDGAICRRRRGRVAIPRRERGGDEQNDGRHDGRADRRHRPRFRRDDGAASPGRDRHGAHPPALRQERAAQAAGPGDHRDPAGGDRRDAACRRRAAAALDRLAHPACCRRRARMPSERRAHDIPPR